MERIKKIGKTIAPGLILAAVALLLLVVSGFVKSSWNAQIKLRNESVSSLQKELETAKTKQQNDASALRTQVTGLDTARVDGDDKIAEDFLKKILSWNSYEEYEAMRTEVMTEYDLRDSAFSSNGFLDVFFPKVEVKVDADGNEYNPIDYGFGDAGELNMQYKGLSSHVINISGDNYTYLTEVTISSSAANGGTGTGTCVFLYTVDKDGALSNLDAYTVASVVK